MDVKSSQSQPPPQYAMMPTAPPNIPTPSGNYKSGSVRPAPNTTTGCCGGAHDVKFKHVHIVLSVIIMAFSLGILGSEIASVILPCKYRGPATGFWLTIINILGAIVSIAASARNASGLNLVACIINMVSFGIDIIMCIVSGVMSGIIRGSYWMSGEFDFDSFSRTRDQCIFKSYQFQAAIAGLCFFMGIFNLINAIFSFVEICKCCDNGMIPGRVVAPPMPVTASQIPPQQQYYPTQQAAHGAMQYQMPAPQPQPTGFVQQQQPYQPPPSQQQQQISQQMPPQYTAN